MQKQEKLLKTVFIYGAILDALAMIPMLSRRIENMMWGVDETEAGYSYAMAYGSALMAGWTSLLVWGSRKPLERRFLAPLTIQVIIGLVAAQIFAVKKGIVSAKRLVPTWILQAITTTFFARAYAASKDNPGTR